MKIAALDLGSNSFLCLICEGFARGEGEGRASNTQETVASGVQESSANRPPAQQITKIIHDQVKIVRLGQGLGQSGVFHPEALRRAEECLIEFKKEIDKHKPDRVLAMATSAARDAKNGHELIAIGDRVGIPIKIIPGADEARITYSGAVSGLASKGNPKNILLIDIGGGSTEFILGHGDQILFAKSLDVGVVRFTERYISENPVSAVEQNKAEDEIRKQIETIKAEINKFRIDEVVAVAGTPTTLAAAELGGFDANKIDGYQFSLAALKSWEDRLANSAVAERVEKYKIDAGRADVIYLGALILRIATEEFAQEKLSVSTRGVRFGVALEILSGRA